MVAEFSAAFAAANMRPLLLDYAERLALWYVSGVALLAGVTGLLALPLSIVLLAFRKEWPSSNQPAEFFILAPFLAAIGGGALSFAAYTELLKRRPAQLHLGIPARPRSTSVIVALVLLPGPALVVNPFLYRWLATIAASMESKIGLPETELAMLLTTPIWMAVLLPSAGLVAFAATLTIAGPAGLLLYLGGSQRTGRILLLFWLLQLVLLVSSVPIILHTKSPEVQGEAIGFIAVLLCAVFLGYAVPVHALRQGNWSEQPAVTEQSAKPGEETPK